jgi:hypothetical protein
MSAAPPSVPDSAPRSAEIVHLSWCDPAYCDTAAGPRDVHHCSTPVTWTAAHDDAELSLARYQYAGGESGFLLMICRTGVVDEHASVLLTNEDLARMTTVIRGAGLAAEASIKRVTG